jgi:small subunit ribosomal protein S21
VDRSSPPSEGSLVLFSGTPVSSKRDEAELGPIEVVVERDNVQRAISQLKRLMAREGILKELKNRRFYEKPSIKDKRKRRDAERRRRKEVRKERAARRRF